jgi:KaiC/GvpD/RAD55 family RecA-like ATPase
MIYTEEIDSFIHGIDTTDHVLLFYDTQESKRRILYSYLAEGLKQGKGIVYVHTEETPQDIYKGLASHSIDVDPNLASGSILTPKYDEFYIVDRKVEALKILNKWHETNSYFQSKGLGLRAAGEMSCFFKEDKVRELLRYEYALHKVLYIPMDAICAYNLKTIVETGYTDIIMPLVRAHGKAVFTAEGGTMVLEPENVEETDIERLLEIQI